MNRYERLISIWESKGIRFAEIRLIKPLKGYYHRRTPADAAIYIDPDLPASEKHCVCMEEIGHHHTAAGNSLTQNKGQYQKTEYLSMRWVYKNCLTLDMLGQSYIDNDGNIYAMADDLEVSVPFLEDAITFFTNKYGVYHKTERFIVRFIPAFWAAPINAQM